MAPFLLYVEASLVCISPLSRELFRRWSWVVVFRGQNLANRSAREWGVASAAGVANGAKHQVKIMVPEY